jgi:hypothetical protein
MSKSPVMHSSESFLLGDSKIEEVQEDTETQEETEVELVEKKNKIEEAPEETETITVVDVDQDEALKELELKEKKKKLVSTENLIEIKVEGENFKNAETRESSGPCTHEIFINEPKMNHPSTLWNFFFPKFPSNYVKSTKYKW